MKRQLVIHILSTMLVLSLTMVARAAVKPNSLFSDGAVLQREVSVPVWGTANDGEKVTVSIDGQAAGTTAKDGRWLVKLKPLKAGGPFTMTIAGENTIIVSNILVGEVWLCSGQSNMEWPLVNTTGSTQAIAQAADPLLRLLTVPREAKDEPQREVAATWQECATNTVGRFSAVGYYFGRDLRKQLNMPVGLINSSVGGTPAEAWTSREALAAVPELATMLQGQIDAIKKYPAALEQYKAKEPELLEKYNEAVAKAKAEGKPAPRKPAPPMDPTQNRNRPSGLYNAMIAPLQPYTIRGVIWYQGESNNGRAKQYQTLFPAMIENWRQAWNEGAFPFLFVQIAPNQGMSPEIREAQLVSWQKTSNTAMVVITDHGTATDIHPRNKEPVGARLALTARAIAYGEKIEYSGPVYVSMKIDSDRAILSFSHVGGGLVAKGGDLRGFTIAGDDKKFVPAEAKIDRDRVIVSAAAVAKPVAVRYGWANVPDVNLFNKADLPASPFRTDDWVAGK